MSLRQFLNLVTLNRKNGIYSLRRLDLSRLDLFYPTTPRKAEQKKLNLKEMESIRLPVASLRFHPNPSPDSVHHKWKVDCFGLSENKIICTDNCGLAFLYDAGLRSVVPLPALHSPKRCPISLSVPDTKEYGRGGGASLYVMEKVPRPRPDKAQVEAFCYAMSEMSYDRSWYHRSLPPPPYVLDPGYENSPTLSYAVLGDGSHICISAMGRGTYCLDTATGEWSYSGDWMLPFYGKAEYVPEFNLWFGISDKDFLPCVSDLSCALKGEKPVLCGVWRNRFPPEWESFRATQIVNMGSGRFCMLDFFHTVGKETDYGGNPVIANVFTVFTGVELLPYGKGGKIGNGDGNGNGSHVSCNGNDNYNGSHRSCNGNGDHDGSHGSCNGNSGHDGSNGKGNGNGKRGFRIINHKSKLYSSDGNAGIEVVV
ncbi:unnamed protein product [Urochloa humidicola]